jgi:predicted Zn-dependent protease
MNDNTRFLSNARSKILLAGLALIGGVSVMLGGCASDATVRSLAASTNSQIIKGHSDAMSKSTDVQAYVNRLAADVLESAREDRPRFESLVHKGPPTSEQSAEDDWIYDKFEATVVLDGQPNAFVVGDDKVYIHSGLITAIETPEQLVACLAHEFSHIRLRHSKNNINNERLQVGAGILAIVGGVAGGRVGGGLAVAGGAGGLISAGLTHSHNKAEEMEADKEALSLYTGMGYDPEQFARFFDLLKEKYGDGPATSTHPRNSERAAQIRTLAREQGSVPSRSLDLHEFKKIQALLASEQQAFAGESPLSNPALRSSLMSCFDYCQIEDGRR